MNGIYRKPYEVNTSECDFNGDLSIYYIVRLFQDIATAHAEIMGVGYDAMQKKNMYWVAVKTIVNINKRPHMFDDVTLETFPALPDKLRCNRFYNIYDWNNEIMVSGKTEWVVINTLTKRPAQVRDVYPSNMEYVNDGNMLDMEFTRFPLDYSDYVFVTDYTVKSQDIDLGEHTNNAEYVRMVYNLFSVSELKSFRVKTFEINYKNASYEGQILKFYKKEYSNIIEFVAVSNDKVIINAKITKE